MLAVVSRVFLLPRYVLGGGTGLFLLLVVVPYLKGLYLRVNQQKPPSIPRRVGETFLVGCLAPLGGWAVFFLAMLLVASAVSDSAGSGLLVLIPVAAGVVPCAGIQWAFLRTGPRLRWRQEVVLVSICILGVVLTGAAGLGFLQRVRHLEKGRMEMSNLKAIGIVMRLYHDAYGRFPDDLRRLVDEGNDPALFLSPFGKGDVQRPVTHPYTGPVDYRYIPLGEGVPKDLVWVWVDPSFYDGEGGWVLRFSGRAEWLKPSQLLGELGRTYEWLLSHGPGPATAP